MKNVMVRAWEIAKEAVNKFGGKVKDFFAQALKMAWAESKTTQFEFYGIKTWFLYDALSQNERYVISISDMEMVKETEKAVLIKFTNGKYVFTKWIPKAALITAEDVRIQAERKQASFHRYNKVLEFAKANNLKVRNKMKLSTIMAKIEESGLTLAV